MDIQEQEAIFLNEMDKRIGQLSEEFDLSAIFMIGALDILKARITDQFLCFLGEVEEEDEDAEERGF